MNGRTTLNAGTIFWGMVLLLGLLLPWLGRLSPSTVERVYTRRIFPWVADATGVVSGLFVISLAQAALLLLLALLLLAAGRTAWRLFRGRPVRTRVGRLVAAAAVLVWFYELSAGIASARPPLMARMGLSSVPPDVPRLARLTERLSDEANRSWQEAVEAGELRQTTDPARESSYLVTRDEVAKSLAEAYAGIDPATGRLSLSPPKFPALAGWLMTRSGISGIFFPFTGEANVNDRLPDASVPSVMAHEMAHQRGVGREDEANFLAYLACRASKLPAVRYSGALSAYSLAAAALARTDPRAWAELKDGLLTPGPRADRDAIRRFWSKAGGPMERVADRINDAYLKANAQAAGVGGYSRIELFLAWDEAHPSDAAQRLDAGRCLARSEGGE